ncbi:anaerobic glycerol-3-phosphate dehydrogenase subunit A [Spirochaetota bacterium]
MEKLKTDVIVIGGGATGTGIARDLAMRGIDTILIEKDDISSGTTGRNHGLLHSGARYAVKDIESAKECIAENKILKKIARHCIEDTGGIFATLYNDDPTYHTKLLEACKFAGIKADEISIRKALSIEPNLTPYTMRAIKVPDAIIDPFRLAASNMLDAKERGARILTHTRVNGIIRDGYNIAGVKCTSNKNEKTEIHADMIINASGIWGQQICGLADIDIKMFPSKGSMLIIDYRINNVVVNRCRPPSDADIVVPGDTVSLIGTTSKEIDYSEIDNPRVDDDEIQLLLKNGEELIPNVLKTRSLRSYCGVRPLISISGENEGRNISRGIVIIDHKDRDGIEGIITVAGGKLITYRLMAEMAVDLVCKKINVKKKCTTHKTPLPGSEKSISRKKSLKSFSGFPASIVGSTLYRHGHRVYNILKKDKKNYRVICECEMVTEGEFEYALNNLNIQTITDLRRRIRIGMGPCQGALCSYRIAGLFQEFGKASSEESIILLQEFLEERWKGIKPVLWGDSLRESEFTYWIYQGLFGLGDI